MAIDQDPKNPNRKENWDKILSYWMLLKHVMTNEKRMLPFHEAIMLFTSEKDEWTIEQSFTDEHQIEVARILYGKKKETKE